MIDEPAPDPTPTLSAPDAPPREPFRCGRPKEECDACPNADHDGLDRLLDAQLAGTSRDRMPAVYLSGPMSGVEHHNFPAFNELARKLRLLGFPVLNPADYGANPRLSWADCVARDCNTLAYAQVVVLLDEWDNSQGAGAEVDHAKHLGIPVLTVPCFMQRVATRYFTPVDLQALARLDQCREELVVAVLDDADGTPRAIVVGDADGIEGEIARVEADLARRAKDDRDALRN